MHDEPNSTDRNDGSSARSNSGNQEEVALVTVPLGPEHEVSEFTCEKSTRVERFLKVDCHPLTRIGYTRVFVFTDGTDPAKVLGYYSLSAAHVERDLMNNRFRGSLPAVPAPMALIGFMGRDDRVPKGTLGPILIQDAARRVYRANDIGMWGLMLNAETEGLVPWYEKAGFKLVPPERTSPKTPRLMYGPLRNFLPELHDAPHTLKD